LQSVEGKVAVVTGAASGIGLGIARAFVGAGARVVLSDNRADALTAAVNDLKAQGHEVVGVPTDVSKLAEVEALAEAALDSYGSVDVLCNNAGVGLFKPVAKTSIEDWEWTLAIDLWGPIHGVKTFLPIIERQPEGHINSTSSMAGLLAVRALGAYNVAKHGVVALMATLQRELRAAHSPVYASVLCPGAVNTGIGRNSVDSRRAKDGVAPTRERGGRAEGRSIWVRCRSHGSLRRRAAVGAVRPAAGFTDRMLRAWGSGRAMVEDGAEPTQDGVRANTSRGFLARRGILISASSGSLRAARRGVSCDHDVGIALDGSARRVAEKRCHSTRRPRAAHAGSHDRSPPRKQARSLLGPRSSPRPAHRLVADAERISKQHGDDLGRVAVRR
jgi:NAD(P)-dependent dehydrogenase (short-subunit alcohol dehydrogenase family)